MKKVVAFLVVSSLWVSTVSADCESKSVIFFKSECTQAFLKGFGAGAASSLGIDFLRNTLLSSITPCNAYRSCGTSRDQLAGQIKVATAALGLAAYDLENFSKFKKIGAQLVGIIFGSLFSSYVVKAVTPQP